MNQELDNDFVITYLVIFMDLLLTLFWVGLLCRGCHP